MEWISVAFFTIGVFAWAFFVNVTWKTLAWSPVYLFCLAIMTGVI